MLVHIGTVQLNKFFLFILSDPAPPARALEPEFLVLDEPTAALDISVKVLQKRMNLTTLFISHDLQIIGQMSDTVAVLHKGRVAESGKTADLLRCPSHPYTIRLVEAARESEAWFGNEILYPGK